MVLAKLDIARHALAEARGIEDVKELRDQAAAMQSYMRQRDYSLSCQNDAIEIKLRAERKLGELTQEMEKNKGAATPLQDERASASTPTYKDLGLDYVQVHRWQQAAELPEEAFEDHVAQTRSRGELLTSEGVRRRAKDFQRSTARQANEDLTKTATPLLEYLQGEVFSTIVIDPPWDWEDEGDVSQFGRGNPTYNTHSIADLEALPISSVSSVNAHLYLWITNRSLPKGFALLEKWGFRYVTCLTWCKPSIGMGNYFRGSTEHILFGIKGSLSLLRNDIGTWFEAPRGSQHSAKPDRLYELVEQCSPGPWLDVYSRKQRPGWVVWGAEA